MQLVFGATLSTMEHLRRTGPDRAGARLALAFLCLLALCCFQGACQQGSIPPELLKLLRQVNAMCGPDVRSGEGSEG